MMLQEVPCPLCKRFHSQAVLAENGYRGVKCQNCQLIYLSPRPNQEDILQLYHSVSHTSGNGLGAEGWAKRLKAKYTLSLVQSYLSGGKVLEIGPGAGSFLLTLRQYGFEVFGIELNDQLADFLKNTYQIPCETKPLSVESFGPKTFDLIYHCDVLSHFYNPLAEFSLMHSKLKLDGYLVFETGNLGEVHPRYYQWYPSFRYPEHLNFFGARSLKLLLERTGFELVRLHRYPLRYSLLGERVHYAWRNKPIHSNVLSNPGSLSHKTEAQFKPAKAVRNFCKQIFHCTVDYILPYRLGIDRLIRIPTDQPQTLIAVARKARHGKVSS